MLRRRSWGMVAALVAPLVVSNAVFAQQPVDEEEELGEELPEEEAPAPAPGAPAPAPAAPEAPAPEAPVEDFAEAEEEENPRRPPPAGKGVIWGVITDAASKEPIIDAQVTEVKSNRKAIADLDGRYRLELSPGEYEIRVWYEIYKAERVQNIRVKVGELTRIDVALGKDEQQATEEVIEVEFEVERASVASQLLLRKNAAQVGDAIGAQEISRTPDRSASEAAKRVVGATVIGGRYVVVRGLGDRYTNSLLNGAPLPSPEPDRQAVPLDLFPTLILSDITILKTFTPDMPGDFAGGSVRINTRELPSRFQAQAQLTLGFNTLSTFQDRVSYEGGGLDWLGVDDGTRALPEGFPDYKVVRLGPKPEGGRITDDEVNGYARDLVTTMELGRTLNLPNGSGNLVVGNTFDLGGGQKLGFTSALTYSRRFVRRPEEILRNYLPPLSFDPADAGEVRPRNDYLADTGTDQVLLGGLATATWNPGRDDKVTLTGIHSRSSEDEGRAIRGFNEERQGGIEDTRLRFVSRSLTFGQLTGEHRFPDFFNASLNWNASASLATTDEPNTRQNVYTADNQEPDVFGFEEGAQSGSFFFSEQDEQSFGGGLDWTQPLVEGDRPVRLKAGTLVTIRRRAFEARRFRFLPLSGASQEVLRLRPDRLFSDENIGTVISLEETTRNNDAYDADYDVYAGYMMADVSLSRRLRAIVGGRVEASRQTIRSFDPFTPELPVENTLANTELLPALSLLYKVTPRVNLRFAASKTVGRPQLRELAPFVFTDYFGANEVQGYPDLRQTTIFNGDLRFEFFPSVGEVVAVSVFYKDFRDPIEQIIRAAGSRGLISYTNAAGGRNAGVEVELRKNMRFVAPPLKDFQVIANATLVSSRVNIEPDAADADDIGGIQTNAVRPLAGQSPFVINVGVDYASEDSGTRARVLYNVFGPRIAQVGASRLPDVYEQPRHQVDLTFAQFVGKHVDVKLTVENLLDWPVLFTQGENAAGEPNVTNEYRNGVSASMGVIVTN